MDFFHAVGADGLSHGNEGVQPTGHPVGRDDAFRHAPLAKFDRHPLTKHRNPPRRGAHIDDAKVEGVGAAVNDGHSAEGVHGQRFNSKGP